MSISRAPCVPWRHPACGQVAGPPLPEHAVAQSVSRSGVSMPYAAVASATSLQLPRTPSRNASLDAPTAPLRAKVLCHLRVVVQASGNGPAIALNTPRAFAVLHLAANQGKRGFCGLDHGQPSIGFGNVRLTSFAGLELNRRYVHDGGHPVTRASLASWPAGPWPTPRSHDAGGRGR